MKARKLTLLIACAALLVVCILQAVLKNSDKVKVFEMKDVPDELVITTPEETYTISKINDDWVIGEKKYPANASYVESAIDALKSFNGLDKVASTNNEVARAKYDLSDAKKISVVAKKSGKVIRSLEIGKNSTASSQSYVSVDGSHDIYLASGGLRNEFNQKLDYFRSKVVVNLSKNDISSISIASEDREAWTVSRTGQGENVSWVVSRPDVLVDATKATEWFNGFSTISTPIWHEENEDLGGTKLLSAVITEGSKKITMDIFEIPAAAEGGNPVYYGKSNATPYTFELAAYTVQRFQKNVEDLLQ